MMEHEMATNRRPRAKGTPGDKLGKGGGDAALAPAADAEIPASSVPEPAAPISAPPAPVIKPVGGDAWASLLSGSPWSSPGAASPTEAALKPVMPSALAAAVANAPPEAAPFTELVSHWSPPFRRQPDREYEEINPAEAAIPVTAAAPEPEPEPVPEPEPEPEPEAAHDHAATETEGVTEMMTSDVELEIEIEIASDVEVVEAPAVIEPSPRPQAFSHSTAYAYPAEPAPAVETAAEAAPAGPAENPVKEVPVEDLFTGIFNVADSAVRGAIGASTDLLRDPKSLGGKLSVAGQSLVHSIKGRFNALLAPRHGAKSNGDEF
ncbi:FraH protein [Magnetospirillum sp. XM-1]|uniref:FraH protein n=1 Tax=Magnetospirillum sp. XM-1 TaxID=1663591 RepID=UPI0008382643|nr:FraH protein [Magnetospirillum sp. XM-1]